MRITSVIERVDRLYPNPYTQAEKIAWCDELSAIIRQQVKKIYNSLRTTISKGEPLLLPANITMEMIEYMYLNGEKLDKTDFRSLILGEAAEGGEVRLIYLRPTEKIRNVELYCLNVDLEYDKSLTGEKRGIIIPMEAPPFRIGDIVEFTFNFPYESPVYSGQTCGVIDVTYNTVVVTQEPGERKGAKLGLRRVITESTEVDAPHDVMYQHYVIMQICYYQQDYDAYNAHLNLFKSVLESYTSWHKARNPVVKFLGFANYWQG